MKKFLNLFLGLTFVLILAACGSGNEEESTEEDTADASENSD